VDAHNPVPHIASAEPLAAYMARHRIADAIRPTHLNKTPPLLRSASHVLLKPSDLLPDVRGWRVLLG